MPDWKAEILRRLAGTRVSPARRAEIVEELTQHLEDRYQEQMAQGRSATEASRAALTELQDHDVFARELRQVEDVRPGDEPQSRWFDGCWADARHALFSLVRRPAQSAVVIVTLAVGMAATTTIWAIVDAVVVRPLPYADADRLVSAGVMFPGSSWREDAPHLQRLAGTSVGDIVDWQARTQSFEALVPVELMSLLVPDGAYGPELANAARVGPEFFGVLGATPVLGRLLVPSDFELDVSPALVLSYATWQSRYGGDPTVIGRQEGRMTIVGVLDASFEAPTGVVWRRTEYWSALRPKSGNYSDRGRRTAGVLGLLANGVTIEAARAELAAVQELINEEYPEGHVYPDGSGMSAGVNPLHAETVGAARRPLMIFFAAAALLLGIACLNAVNLLLLRGIDRRNELALRRALGAGRLRLLRGSLFESVWLALGGGALGAALAYGGVEAFLRFGPTNLPRLADVAVDARVLAATALASMGAGLVVGLVPALRAARTGSLGTGLKGGDGRTLAPSGNRFRSALVTAQLAIATVLAVGAGLLFASFVNVATSEIGFEPDRLTVFQVAAKGVPGPDSWQPWEEMRRQAQQVAGVESVSVASDAPFRTPSWAPGIRLVGEAADATRTGNYGFVVTPSFLDTLGGRVVAGRWFNDTDGPTTVPVVVVNETFAARHLAGRDPIGSIVVSGPGEGVQWTVVGVVADIVQRRVEDEMRPAIYRPHMQEPWVFTPTVMVRSERAADGLAGELRGAASRAYPGLPVLGLQAMSELIDSVQVEPRFRALLFGTFAGISLLLAAVGLYGSLAHSVGQRTKELGIRMALGADGRRIFAMVAGQGATICGFGLVLGLIGAILLTRFVEGFLFDVAALDPSIYLLATGVFVAVSIVAVWSPARRAARVDISRSLWLD